MRCLKVTSEAIFIGPKSRFAILSKQQKFNSYYTYPLWGSDRRLVARKFCACVAATYGRHAPAAEKICSEIAS